jgi:hypothetical protein
MSQKATPKPNAFSKSQGPRRKFTPILIEKFNIKNFGLTDLEINNERSESQMIAYPRHNSSTFVFQTPEFQMTQGGIPPLGKYAKTDAQRTTIKFPFDPTQKACDDMKEMFSQIDDYMVDQSKNIFKGSVAKFKFNYKSIVRDPVEEETMEEEPKDKKEKKPKFQFWKAKLDLAYPTGEIQTTIFKRDPENPTAKPEKVSVKTPTDLSEYLTWNSKVRMIVMMNKMWADKNEKEKGSGRKYGLAFKILSMEITPRESAGSYKDAVANYAFVDEDETPNDLDAGVEDDADQDQDQDEDVEEVEVEVEVDADDADDEDDQEDDEVVDVEPVKPTPKSNPKSGTKAPAQPKTQRTKK